MEIPYLIRKSGMYYGHNSCGRVNQPLMAEIYTKEDAERRASHCDECQAVPLTEAITNSEEVQKYLARIGVMHGAMVRTEEPKIITGNYQRMPYLTPEDLDAVRAGIEGKRLEHSGLSCKISQYDAGKLAAFDEMLELLDDNETSGEDDEEIQGSKGY